MEDKIDDKHSTFAGFRLEGDTVVPCTIAVTTGHPLSTLDTRWSCVVVGFRVKVVPSFPTNVLPDRHPVTLCPHDERVTVARLLTGLFTGLSLLEWYLVVVFRKDTMKKRPITIPIKGGMQCFVQVSIGQVPTRMTRLLGW